MSETACIMYSSTPLQTTRKSFDISTSCKNTTVGRDFGEIEERLSRAQTCNKRSQSNYKKLPRQKTKTQTFNKSYTLYKLNKDNITYFKVK